MKLTDRLNIRNKQAEKLLREADEALTNLSNSGTLDKRLFMELNGAILEALLIAFKQLDNNTTPAKTLLEFTGRDIRDACLRVGPSQVFEADDQYVIAVLQELTR